MGRWTWHEKSRGVSAPPTHLVGVETVLIVEELGGHEPECAVRLDDDVDGGYDGTDVEVGQLHQHCIITKEMVILVRCLLPRQQVPPDEYIVTFEVLADDATTVQVLKAICDLRHKR